MAVSLKKRSRLRFGTLLVLDGYEFWDLFEPPEIVPQADDFFYTVQGIDRLDLIANKVYGDPVLWWVIALANDMELIPSDMNEGDVIRIPSVRYVQESLFSKVNQ